MHSRYVNIKDSVMKYIRELSWDAARNFGTVVLQREAVEREREQDPASQPLRRRGPGWRRGSCGL